MVEGGINEQHERGEHRRWRIRAMEFIVKALCIEFDCHDGQSSDGVCFALGRLRISFNMKQFSAENQ